VNASTAGDTVAPSREGTSTGEYARRHSTDGRPGRDITGDDCACGDDGPFPDVYRTNHDGVRANRDIVADDHIARVLPREIGSQASVVLELAASTDLHVGVDNNAQAMVVQDEVVRQPCLRRQNRTEDHLYREGDQLGWTVEPDRPDRVREMMQPKNHVRVMPGGAGG
jgi:hypothetical protein